jgi:hypothetical protein
VRCCWCVDGGVMVVTSDVQAVTNLLPCPRSSNAAILLIVRSKLCASSRSCRRACRVAKRSRVLPTPRSWSSLDQRDRLCRKRRPPLKPWFVAIVGEEETEQRFLKSTSDLAEMVDKAAQERAEWHLGADTADFMAKAVLRLRSMMRDVQRAWSQARATATCTKWVKVFRSAHAADLAAYTIDVGKNAKRPVEDNWVFG